jgi:hypothetical protein
MNLPLPIRSLRDKEETANDNQDSKTSLEELIEFEEILSSPRAFIEANTIPGSLSEIQNKHIIPTFARDNETAISIAEFIETTQRAVQEVYSSETILPPNIRLSHPVKGRIPEARNKVASELLESEKTLYYERAAFIIEVPTISTSIGGNLLNLTIGGVKAYNLDSLMGKSGVDQHFKFFIGFKCLVCTNLCVSSDGYVGSLKAKSVQQLHTAILRIIQDFDAVDFQRRLGALLQYSITETQFAQLVGRCRMYRHLPEGMKQGIPELMFGDSQINSVCRDYYQDKNFCGQIDGSINLWDLYNLFTAANRGSYIDTFLDRGVHALDLVDEVKLALSAGNNSWFLS